MKTKIFDINFEGRSLRYRWELDADLNHRITSLSTGVSSGWVAYNSVAYLPSEDVAVFASYWQGVVPVETVVRLKPFDLSTEQTL